MTVGSPMVTAPMRRVAAVACTLLLLGVSWPSHADDRGYFGLSAPGTIKVDSEGKTRLDGSAGGKHRYLTVDATQTIRALEAFVYLASQPPGIN